MTECVVEHVLKGLDVVDDVPVEHRPLAYFVRIDFVELISYKVHGVDHFVN